MFWLINCIIGACTKRIPRKRQITENDAAAEDRMYDLVWLCLNRGKTHPEIGFNLEEADDDFILDIISPVAKYIDARNDCSDFRALLMLIVMFAAGDKMKDCPKSSELIGKTLMGFKYWISDPGKDSMCYYSENHQIVFAAVEYLTAQLYPNGTNTNDGKSSGFHKVRAEERINTWCDLRDTYGFSEFLSNNYLPVDVSALSALVLFADNEKLVSEAKNKISLILRDYGENLFQGSFINASARDYPRNLMNPYRDGSSKIIIESVWGSIDRALMLRGHMATLFAVLIAQGRYAVPKFIVDLGKRTRLDTTRRYGLSTNNYDIEKLTGTDDRTLMMMLGSGALTNPGVINTSMAMMRKYKLWHHDFLYWLRFVDMPLVRWLGLAPRVSHLLDYSMNGMALEEGMVHVHRTPFFKISCLEDYHAGSFGAQKTTVAATLDGGVSVYTNNPAFDRNAKPKRTDWDRSPSYFGGYGIAPWAELFADTALVIYRLPRIRKVFSLFKVLPYTHAYLPEELLDEVEICDNRAFARSGEAYIALTGAGKLEYMPFDPAVAASDKRLKDASKHFDLVQRGRKQFWIYELGSSENETFAEFKERIGRHTVQFDGRVLTLEGDRKITLKYGIRNDK